MSDARPRCPWCGRALAIVHVHGHGQCGSCGVNVEPCCSGAAASVEVDQPPFPGARVDPHFFARLFEGLGGPGCSVSRDALLVAVAQTLGGTRDDADLVLEVACDLGHLERHGDSFRLGRRDESLSPPAP